MNCNFEFQNQSDKTCPNCGRIRAERTTTGFVDAGFYVKMKDGHDVGPVPLSTLAQMLKDGAIDADTPLVNEEQGKVFFADEHPFLKGLLPQAAPVKAAPDAPKPPQPSANPFPYKVAALAGVATMILVLIILAFAIQRHGS